MFGLLQTINEPSQRLLGKTDAKAELGKITNKPLKK